MFSKTKKTNRDPLGIQSTQQARVFLHEDQNMSEMQENLQKLIADKDLRIKLGTNAIKGMDKFSIETIASMYKTLFKNILKK